MQMPPRSLGHHYNYCNVTYDYTLVYPLNYKMKEKNGNFFLKLKKKKQKNIFSQNEN